MNITISTGYIVRRNHIDRDGDPRVIVLRKSWIKSFDAQCQIRDFWQNRRLC